MSLFFVFFFFFKQKTAYEMRISDWSSDVCSSDLSDLLPWPDAMIRTLCAGTEGIAAASCEPLALLPTSKRPAFCVGVVRDENKMPRNDSIALTVLSAGCVPDVALTLPGADGFESLNEKICPPNDCLPSWCS